MKPHKNVIDVLLACVAAMLLLHALSPGTVVVPVLGQPAAQEAAPEEEAPPVLSPFA